MRKNITVIFVGIELIENQPQKMETESSSFSRFVVIAARRDTDSSESWTAWEIRSSEILMLI